MLVPVDLRNINDCFDVSEFLCYQDKVTKYNVKGTEIGTVRQ